jgi:DNA-binding PadR family transcriptional regulator
MAGKSGKESKKGKAELADVLAELASLRQEIEALKAPVAAPLGALAHTAEQVARQASAFTPVQRARLIEALLRDGPQTPPTLGAAVGLATGSLYHHLRELVAAGIATVEDKTYCLTPEGQRLAEVFFTLPTS